MRLWMFFAGLLLVSSSAAQNVGEMAPDFEYPALDGGQIRLADHRGKVVFVFLFGNTCPFCLAVGNRTETEIEQVYGGNPSFQALGLDLWTSTSNASSVGAFRSQTGITYPLGLRAGDMAGRYATTYDRLLVIGPDGILRYKGSSNVSNTLTEARGIVESLLDAVAAGTEELPEFGFSLQPNFPNPFATHTEIPFRLASAGLVRLRVHDLLGRTVAVLADGYRPAGAGSVTWSPSRDLPAGLYFYTLEAAGDRQSRTLLLGR